MSDRPHAPPTTTGVTARAMNQSRLVLATLTMAVAVTVGSCGGISSTAPVGVDGSTGTTAGSPSPDERMAAVVTTGCGSASATIGSAVRVDREAFLTTAHVVAGARHVAVVDSGDLPADRQWPDFSPAMLFETAAEATIVAFDTARDLALVTTGDPGRQFGGDEVPELDTAAVDAAVVIHGVATSEPVDGIVADRTLIVADEVRGGSRVERDGYRLDALTTNGDSGAGVWSVDGRLVGLVFAVSTADSTRTWAVSGLEVEHFLDDVQGRPPRSYVCDEPSSRVIAER